MRTVYMCFRVCTGMIVLVDSYCKKEQGKDHFSCKCTSVRLQRERITQHLDIPLQEFRGPPQVRETNRIICKSSVIKNVIKYHVFISSIHSLQKKIITTKICESKNLSVS